MFFEKFSDTVQNLILISSSSTLAFVIAMALTPWFYKQLQKYKLGKKIRENALSGEKSTLFSQLHAKKSGTPTMGGLLILMSIVAVVIFSRGLSFLGIFERSLLNRNETWIILFTLITYGALGAIDDYLNVKEIGKTKGLSAKWKSVWLITLSALLASWFFFKLGYNAISIPWPGTAPIHVGWLFIPIFMFIVIATANAVNFTDGLDGLASGLLIMAFGAFGIIAYAMELYILAALCGVIAGATVAFLWFNVPPAKFYMGDTGSMALGATLGVIAMLLDKMLVLPIIGFIFVIEALSVIIQLFSKKYFGRKVFKIAPIHHHFEKSGWAEFTVVMRFWIIGGIMATFGTILALIDLT